MKSIKKILIIALIILLVMVGCKKKDTKFFLEDKYYNVTTFKEIESNVLNELVNNKESFAVYIYQPACAASYNFNKVLEEFIKKNQVSLYKMTYAEMKKNSLNKQVKHYPSVVIYKKGEVIDYLDANDGDDTKYYENAENFEQWFTDYVKLKEINSDYNTSIDENEINTDIKIDAVLENITYDENKVNIYFFWGDGCPHCEEEFALFERIYEKYGDYYNLNTFETWKNEENSELMYQFAAKMGDDVGGVPYTIIGSQSFSGYLTSSEDKMIKAIMEEYQNSYDVYFDNK